MDRNHKNLLSQNIESLHTLNRMFDNGEVTKEYYEKKKYKLEHPYEERNKRRQNETPRIWVPRTENKVKHKEYLESEKWGKRKETYYKNHKKECDTCESTFNIQIHHLNYLNLGGEKDEDLVALCYICHKDFHDRYGTQTKSYKNYKIFKEIKKNEKIGNLPKVMGQ